jgi:D-alanyl-D-alanine endopeptidase (penicillin-binding protein 7)
VALVLDEREGVALFEQRADRPRPIASLTKLMTAMVVLDAKQPLDEAIVIADADRDRLRGSRSKLAVGSAWTRRDLLAATLGASDNRAAAALARSYPGGTGAALAAMNAKAAALGMTHSRFADASGLDSRNVATARDLALLAAAAQRYEPVRTLSTTARYEITELGGGTPLAFINSNFLVRGAEWEIALSKTGYTADAGNCLLMQATVGDRPVTIVLLNSWGWFAKYSDSNRIRDWLIRTERKLTALNANAAEPRG